ncbi:TPA: hypothetical protein KSL09_003211 [Clostridioides difficile]|nr:hypothetical protein [Clostridioides difficile]HEK5054474.1 hypothetical protein [Clostridioides difficile]
MPSNYEKLDTDKLIFLSKVSGHELEKFIAKLEELYEKDIQEKDVLDSGAED